MGAQSTFIALAALLVLTACQPDETTPTPLQFQSMGTTGTIKTRGAEPPSDLPELFHALDAELSHWQPTTPLSRFNASPASSPFPAPLALVDIVLLANQLNKRTGGAFDITLGSGTLSADRATSTLTKSSDNTHIDLSAIAKGYAIDRAAERLEAVGIDDYLIEFGGELRAGPGGAWTVGIEHPAGGLLRTISLRGKSVATSGTYRLGEHIIDPDKGQPASNQVVAASVLAPTAAEADALATAAVVTGEALGDASLLFSDGTARETGLFRP